MNSWFDRFKSATHRTGLRIKMSGQPKGPEHRLVNPWHAVSIATVPGGGCPCAQLLSKQRYLSGEAPRLPLAECSNTAACACQYRHHSDRRDGLRRAQDMGMPPKSRDYAERRTSRHGRRATDH